MGMIQMIFCDCLFSCLHRSRTHYWICAWQCLTTEEINSSIDHNVCGDESASRLWPNGAREAHPDDLQSVQEPLCSSLWVPQRLIYTPPHTQLGSRRPPKPGPAEPAVASEQEGTGEPAEWICRNILLHLFVGDSGEDSYHGQIRAAGWVGGIVVFSWKTDLRVCNRGLLTM